MRVRFTRAPRLQYIHGNGKTDPAQDKPLLASHAQAATVPATDECQPPYVWRLAVPSDHVCVTVQSHQRAVT